MRPKGSADRLEYRRQWAVGLLEEGKSINEVARLVKASPLFGSSVEGTEGRPRGGGAESQTASGPGLSIEYPRQGAVEKTVAGRPPSGWL